MLQVKNVTYRIGGHTLLDSASARIPAGHRVGLVGCNGTGKTTLLNLILGRHEIDGGSIHVRSGSRLGIVAQEAPGGEQTPLESVLSSDSQRSDLLMEARTASDPSRISAIHNRLAEIDAHSAPSRAAVILAGLGFDEQAQSRPLSSFSGGWRMRVALAAVLFIEPDLLLLDEPTNHLDLEASLWLEGHLKNYPHTLLMVSHDRNLLSSAVDHILNLDNSKLEMFTGGYNAFERVRLARQSQNEALTKRQEADRKRIQSFVDKFRAKASKARQAQSRLKILERMAPIAVAAANHSVAFHFPDPLPGPSPLVTLDDTDAGYDPDRPVLKNLHLSIYADNRIALLGRNGNGKTTLARLLAGELSPFSGKIFRSSKLVVGYFAQDQLEQLNTQLTPLEQMRLVMPDDPISQVRGWLGRFGFIEDKALVPVSGLSGGEKTRLVLALLARKKPNLLILDEPTNHLDMDAREALLQALGRYTGAIILISHDRHLIESSVDQLWLVRDETAQVFFGDIDEYHRLLIEERRTTRSSGSNQKSLESRKKTDRKESRRIKAESRARIAPLREKARTAEVILEKLMEEKDKIDADLSDPAFYNGPKEKVAEISRRKKELLSEISKAEELWVEVYAALEEQLSSEE